MGVEIAEGKRKQ